MSDTVKIPEQAREIIKKWEGFEPSAYSDVVGVPTIGYGFTEPALNRIGEPFPDTVSRGEADRLLDRLLTVHFGPEIEKRLEVDLAPHKLGALCSFCYNVGIGAFEDSTLLELLNKGLEEQAEKEFDKWVYAGGKVYEGLVRRRIEERRYFEMDETLYEAAAIERVPCRRVQKIDHDLTIDSLIPDELPDYA